MENNTTPYKPTGKESAIQVVKFALFSASAGIIQTLVFTGLNELTNLPYWPCYLTALICSVISFPSILITSSCFG